MANVGDTYTPEGGAGQGNIDQMTQAVISGFKGLPQMRQNLGETLLAQDPVTGPLADERGKLIQQLFDYDKTLNTKYSDPASPYYVEDPTVRTSQQGEAKNALWGALGNTNALLAARRAVLGSQVEQGVEAYKYGLEAQEKQLQYELERQKLGASGSNQKQNQVLSLATELQMAQADPTLLDRMMKKYTVMGLTPDEVLSTYTIQKGPAGLSALELATKYGTKFDESMSLAERQAAEAQFGQKALSDLFQSAGYDQKTGEFAVAKHGLIGGSLAQLQANLNINPTYENFNAARAAAKTIIMQALSKSALGGVSNVNIQKEADKYLPDYSDSSSEMTNKFNRIAMLLSGRSDIFGNTASAGSMYAGAKNKSISAPYSINQPVTGLSVNPTGITGPTAQPTSSIFVRGR